LALQGHLLWLSTFHQHPLTEFVVEASTAVSRGSSQPRPGLANELSCGLCQMVRQTQALPVTGSPVLHVAASVSRLLLFSPGDSYTRQSIVLLVRAPPVF